MMARLRHCIAVGRAFAFEAHEGVEHDAGDEEADAGGEERGQFFDGDADGEKRGAPEEVDGEEGEEQANPEGLRSSSLSRLPTDTGNH